MLLPPYRAGHEPSPQKPSAAEYGCALCALRAALHTVRLRTVLLTGAIAASVVLNVSGALAAAYSARLATQTLALTNAVAQASGHSKDTKPHEASPPEPPALPRARIPAASASPSPSLSEVSSCVGAGVARLAPSDFAIDRSVIDHLLENVAEHMPFSHVSPERPSGMRLTQVSRTSELASLGFEDGDVLWTINGFDITNPEKALEAYAKLRRADELEVMLSRRGELRIHRYHVH
jgi:hypothetical protein